MAAFGSVPDHEEAYVGSLLRKGGEPLIRKGVDLAMRLLGQQFVLGRTIDEAIANAREREARGYRFSYDMLGERAKTAADADRYFDRYMSAIEAIGDAKGPGSGDFHALMARPSVSVKLSAVHARFEPGKEARLERELLPRLIELATAARGQGIGLTVDAEEQDRLDLTLGLFAGTYCDAALDGWPGLGLAVQAYGKRAAPVLGWLQRLSQLRRKPIPVRLVTFNTHHGVGRDERHDLARLAKVLAAAEADVICLQEVDRHFGERRPCVHCRSLCHCAEVLVRGRPAAGGSSETTQSRWDGVG